jgi:SAM-dependent methyltransferase
MHKFFDRRDFSYLNKIIFRLGKDDPLWFPRLSEITTLGIRGWEYGLMFEHIDFKGKKVLDVGSGNSRLPAYLAKRGAKVTMLDMDHPLEETDIKGGGNLEFISGDMTEMKQIKNCSFDIVICISAIEHVDMKHNSFYDDSEYERRALRSISEMARVLKKNGEFYLTTDFYLENQVTDKWPHSKDRIRGAFKMNSLKKFLDCLNSVGIKLKSKPVYKKETILNDRLRANYRGRFFSTFAFMGKKI